MVRVMSHRLALARRVCWVAAAALCFPLQAANRSPQLKSGQLELVLSNAHDGLVLARLQDTAHARDLLAPVSRPLFTLTLKELGSGKETSVRADAGWLGISARTAARELELNWAGHTNAGLAKLVVTARAKADPRVNAIRWTFKVQNQNTNWSLWRVVFPDLALAEPGSNACLLFPRGPGEVQRGAWTKPTEYRGNYPDGWCSMQFMAAYAEAEGGLYVASHDPWGSTKQLVLKSDPQARSLNVRFEHPAPNMGSAGNGFDLEGEAVWQLFRGDWFDAAMIYKQWVQKEARWWPKLGRDGRQDTPRWMRELSAWTMTGGAPGDCVEKVKIFRSYLGLPLGFHWYNWHQIPFDNDYPHYFPAKNGFAEGVAELKSAGVFPMPYINGRLWDSKDNGATDGEFSRLALPAVTKQPDGSAQLESYGSKETNGEPVRLGVMCPSTALWRNTVSNIVLRLLRECGTSGVYIDQIAAAAPKLCMDRTHGHPAGGGHWWTESYWKMLGDIRRAMPAGTMLTTECNAEPFIRWFDGYLTWHWQHQGQVPAFPAVYGGTVQMFGRAYRGGATKDLALRMKAAQQLVFGEQLGWLDPGVVSEKSNAEFFRQAATTRDRFKRFFYAGEMARPPKFAGALPQVKADWQWSGEWWVSTDAVLAGAWRLPREKRLLLLFANVSDEPVALSLETGASTWNIEKRAECKVTRSAGPTGATESASASALFKRPATFAPREIQAWEIH